MLEKQNFLTLLRASTSFFYMSLALRNTMNSWFERISQRSMFSTSRFKFLPVRRWGPYSFCHTIRAVGWGWKFWKREYPCRPCHLLQHFSMFCLDSTLVIESNSCWWVWKEEAIEEEAFSSYFNVWLLISQEPVINMPPQYVKITWLLETPKELLHYILPFLAAS